MTLLWSRHEPERVGECCAVSGPAVLGRGVGDAAGDLPKLELGRSRPGSTVSSGALTSATLSRRQLRVSPKGNTLHVENLGKRALLHNGVDARECTAVPGDTLAVEGVLLALVSRRPKVLPRIDFADFAFGEADEHGWVGETTQAWALRREVAEVAQRSAHVFIQGPSGVGKELCARAIHRASSRGGGPLVSRNAATIPEALAEAELFGQARHYPNAGSPAREGLLGLASGGTLFLDEVAELGMAQQAALLRVMDAGEYQRLGEDRLRQSDVRVLAATNRGEESLKADLLARFSERVTVPDLNQRRADVPLLIAHLCRRLVRDGETPALPEPSAELVDALCRHRYATNVRELDRLLRLAAKGSPVGTLRLSDAVREKLDLPNDVGELDAASVREVLAKTKSATEAASKLGLPSRYALYRLLKRLDVQTD